MAQGQPTDVVAEAAVADLRLRSLLRATPLAAWAVVATFGILGLVWAIAVPLLHGPDEGAHVDRIAGFSLAEQFTVDPRADLRYSLDLLAAYPEVGIEPVDHRVLPRIPWTPLNTADAAPIDERPPYPALAPFGLADERFLNAARSHPPGYYAAVDALDAVVTTIGVPAVDEAGWDATLARWRAWSALFLLPFPWVAFWVAARLGATVRQGWSGGLRRAPAPRTVGLVAATSTLAVPQLSHSAGTVNNDALLFTGTALCTLACTWIATGDRSRAAALWAGAGAGLAAFSKIFGIGAPVWIVAAVLVGAMAETRRSADAGGSAADAQQTHRSSVREVGARLAVAAVATIAAGGWFTLATLVRFRTVAPRGFGYPQPDDLEVSFVTWLREAAERLTSTGFGRMGVEQFGIPGWSVWLATIVLLVGVGAAFTAPVLAGRHGSGRRGAVGLVLLLPFLTTLAMVAWAAWGGYARSGIPSGLHGRYLFVGAPALAALVAIGLDHLLRSTVRALAAMAVLAVGFQLLGLGVALANWWPGGWWDRVRTAMLFSGWSDPLLGVLTVAGLAAGIALVLGVRREVVT